MVTSEKPKRRIPYLRLTAILLVTAGLAAAGLALFVDIAEKKAEERQYPLMLAKLSDDQVNPETWGVSFPAQYSRYLLMAEPGALTPFGGGVAYSKLMRNPALTRLWAGYPFAADFNEERSHYYSQIDQIETKRNDKEWLNTHGFPAFKGQPGACMNCHSGWAPSLIRELGWETFNKTPYAELSQKLKTQHGEGMQGHALGSTCADCHHPSDMSLRVTRPAYINAMVSRGYKADAKSGLKATHPEMRQHVCQQCHVEYYFKGDNKELTFPWTDWPKGEALSIEMIEAYYDRQAGIEGGFKADWTHKETGAPMLKMQHPEAELYSSGIHARSQVACVDCHMPYKREGALKVTDHFVTSPLHDVKASCQTCHRQSEADIKSRVLAIQERTAAQLKEAEGAILALADDIVAAQKILDDKKLEASKRDGVLAAARKAHRRASMRWDFIASENSTGFHSPQEAGRVLASAVQVARSGQLSLVNAMQEAGLKLQASTAYGTIPPVPHAIDERHRPVGDPPPAALQEIDDKAKNHMTKLP